MERGPPNRLVVLSSEDFRTIEVARAELQEARVSPNPRRLGCLGAIAGVVVFVGWPHLLREIPRLSFFTPFAMLFAFVGAIGGPFVTVFGGLSSRHGSNAAVEVALRVLQAQDSDREEQLRAAVVLVTNASAVPAPSPVWSTDLVAEVKRYMDTRREDSVPEGGGIVEQDE
ncbi:MAG TPA: hypothetical protein DEF01_06330 [Gemmatimonadetes bacterium]|nr:hypothetical protein [Gemmatimonadota bacterium]HBV06342.1 hypothetical protein [Gemmatimonadota bacterium]